MTDTSLQLNIWKFYLFKVFEGFVLYYSIDKILMESRGLSVTDMVQVEIVFAVFLLIFEIPSSAISDRWSRKYVLAINVVFFMLNTFLWAIAQDISLFMIGAFAASISSALKSGTDTSFLYDTLLELSKEETYEKTLGNAIFYESIAAIVAGIAGAMIADYYGLAAPFWLTLIFSFIAVLLALSLREPEIQRTTEEMTYWEHIVSTGRFLWRHPFIYHLIFLTVILGATLNLADEYGQLYFVRVGIPIFVFGYLAAVGNGIEAISAKFSYKLRGYSRGKIYTFLIFVSGGGFVLAGALKSPFGAVFIFLPLLAYYVSFPLISSDLHREFSSGQRATGESFISLLKMTVYIPVALGFGLIADRVSVFSAYITVGAFVGLYLIIFVLVSFRKIGHIETIES